MRVILYLYEDVLLMRYKNGKEKSRTMIKFCVKLKQNTAETC